MTVMSPPLTPFKDAHPETREAYLSGLARLRDINGNPEVWHCTVCDADIDGDDVLISYNVPTPFPYCTTETGPDKSCAGSGRDLVPAV